MARKLRVEYPGAVYHVMNRGDRREAIFRDDQDREVFLAILAGGRRTCPPCQRGRRQGRPGRPAAGGDRDDRPMDRRAPENGRTGLRQPSPVSPPENNSQMKYVNIKNQPLYIQPNEQNRAWDGHGDRRFGLGSGG